MKKAADLMKELGFKEESSTATKEAFIKHLIKAAFGVEVQTPSEKMQTKAPSAKVTNAQLSFDFSSTVFQTNNSDKKVS